MYNFRGFAKKSATIFWSFIFHILVPRLDYFRSKKGKPKIFGFKNAMKREIGKIHIFVKR